MAKKIYILCFLSSVVWVFLFMSTHLWETDVWWHLKTGEQIWKCGELPDYDWFTFTCQNRRWIDLHWLFQTGLYALYTLGGFRLLAVSTSFFITFSLLLAVLPALLKKRWLCGAILLFVSSFVLNQRAFPRPEIASYLFLALYLCILEKYCETKTRWIYVLVFFQIFWVNTHALFILSFVLQTLYLLDEMLATFSKCEKSSPIASAFVSAMGQSFAKNLFYSPLSRTLALCVLVSFLNPYGVEGAFFPLTLLDVIRGTNPIWQQKIEEFKPLWAYRWNCFPPGIAIVFIFVTPLCLFWICKDRISIRHVALYIAFFVLAQMAVRNLALFAIVSVFLTAQMIGTRLSRISEEGSIPDIQAPMAKSVFAWALTAGIMAMIWLLTTQRYYEYAYDGRRFGFDGVSLGRYPAKAVDYIVANKLSGNVFNHLNDGGYLIWRLFPSCRVFIDPRLEVMGEEHFENYWRISRDRKLFDQASTKYDIRIAIVREEEVYQAIFHNNPQWQVCFGDLEESSMVLLRKKR